MPDGSLSHGGKFVKIFNSLGADYGITDRKTFMKFAEQIVYCIGVWLRKKNLVQYVWFRRFLQYRSCNISDLGLKKRFVQYRQNSA